MRNHATGGIANAGPRAQGLLGVFYVLGTAKGHPMGSPLVHQIVAALIS